MVSLLVVMGVVGCGRQREPSSQETPTQQAPVAEEQAPPSEGFAPPPPAPESASAPRDEKKEALDREAPATQGAGRGSGALPGESRELPRKGAPAPAAIPRGRTVDDDDVGTVGGRYAALSIAQAEAELEASFGRLGNALRLSSPDCPSARQFGAKVCELAEHICRLAEQGNDSNELALCVDGRNRCAEARRRLAERCAE